MILLHDTMAGEKRPFEPVKKTLFGRPVVRMYHCGPTVYHYPHIGNLRAYVFADSLKRLMKAHGYKVRQVINITDVGHLVSDGDTGEDKMDKARAREGKSAADIAEFYTRFFMGNLADLNIDTEGTRFPRATEYVPQQIALIKKLEKKGLTYRIDDGIYFDTSKFPGYGKLGNIDLAGLREGERIGVVEGKRNPTDFALWKLSPKSDAAGVREQEWASPWGVGFPGWHIECSAMAMDILGETIDIHTGGIDHIPVHHNNEIAQSEGATGHSFARFWLHSAFLNATGEKMSKSSGDFLTLDSIKARGFSPMEYRYLLLGARYSTPISFSWESLEAARNAYRKLTKAVSELPRKDGTGAAGKVRADIWEKALAFASDDLDTPKVLALQWEVLKDPSISPADKKATLLKIDELLGLAAADHRDGDAKGASDEMPGDVLALIEERARARGAKDWKASDELRDKIAALGFAVKDGPDGQKVERV